MKSLDDGHDSRDDLWLTKRHHGFRLFVQLEILVTLWQNSHGDRFGMPQCFLLLLRVWFGGSPSHADSLRAVYQLASAQRRRFHTGESEFQTVRSTASAKNVGSFFVLFAFPVHISNSASGSMFAAPILRADLIFNKDVFHYGAGIGPSRPCETGDIHQQTKRPNAPGLSLSPASRVLASGFIGFCLGIQTNISERSGDVR